MESFWSLLKRGIGGTYVSVEPFHLFRYVDEQAFRFNNRTMTDELRFRYCDAPDCRTPFNLCRVDRQDGDGAGNLLGVKGAESAT